MCDDVAKPKKFSLRYLFVVTTSFAIGAALATNPYLILAVRSVGLGICAYWVAKAFFAASLRLPSVVRELVFLAGLPIFMFSFYFVLWGIVGTVAHFLPN